MCRPPGSNISKYLDRGGGGSMTLPDRLCMLLAIKDWHGEWENLGAIASHKSTCKLLKGYLEIVGLQFHYK